MATYRAQSMRYRHSQALLAELGARLRARAGGSLAAAAAALAAFSDDWIDIDAEILEGIANDPTAAALAKELRKELAARAQGGTQPPRRRD